ncbi:MAG: hypothetical protein U0670_16350 [Anaerolineae bacterium]
MLSINEILQQAKTLSKQERSELAKLLIDTLADEGSTPPSARHLSELYGLGKEIWGDVDAQDYVNQQRDEWDRDL